MVGLIARREKYLTTKGTVQDSSEVLQKISVKPSKLPTIKKTNNSRHPKTAEVGNPQLAARWEGKRHPEEVGLAEERNPALQERARNSWRVKQATSKREVIVLEGDGAKEEVVLGKSQCGKWQTGQRKALYEGSPDQRKGRLEGQEWSGGAEVEVGYGRGREKAH